MQAGKRTIMVNGLALAVGVTLSATAWGGTPPISVTDDDGDSFAPDETLTQVGDGGVTWIWDSDNVDEHNVTQDNGLFKSGPPVPVDEDFHLDTSAGTFPYYCTNHGDKGGSGMSGELRILPLQVATTAKAPGQQIGVRWAEPARDTGDRFDVDYRVGNGKWKAWRRDTSKAERAFGKNGNPVAVKPDKTYSFRARSKDSSNPGRRKSGWSPKLVVGP